MKANSKQGKSKIEEPSNKKNNKSKKLDDSFEVDDNDKGSFGDIYEEGSDYEDESEKSSHVEEDKGQITDEEEDIEAFENQGGNKTTENILENMSLDEINLRVQNIVNILSDFKNKKEEGHSRDSLMNELKQLLMAYYDYNEDIMTLVTNLFPPHEAIEFLEASGGQRILSLRTNTLKTKRRELAKILINRGVNLDPLADWTKVGLKVYDSAVPVGATPEYLAGHYMLQSGSSFLPVIALDPQENEKVLDMCACPGGKTTYIAQLMKNTGILVANDLKKERLKSLYFNVHRLGVRNCIITNYDGVKLKELYCKFDRILLDAPCSGLGVISKDPSVKVNRVSIYIEYLHI
jgi:25S rRNA (cytosine2870-C5)-methyltransferase